MGLRLKPNANDVERCHYRVSFDRIDRTVYIPRSEVKTLPVVAAIIFCTTVTPSASIASSALFAMTRCLPRIGAWQVVEIPKARRDGRGHVRGAATIGSEGWVE